MKTIHRSKIPEDFLYYRSAFLAFYKYDKEILKFMVKLIGKGYEFINGFNLFGLNIWNINIEKIDIKDSKLLEDFIKDKHGIVFRTPLRETKMPKGWLKLPTFLSKSFIHSSRSAFSILDRKDYWNKWQPRARYSRRKIIELKQKGILKIEECKDLNHFLEIYSSIELKDPNQSWILKWCKFSFGDEEIRKRLRVYFGEINGEILAGGIFIDEGVTSEYFTAFNKEEGKKYYLGTAIIDKWFYDSYKLGIKYCDLDHLRDKYQSKSYEGYTKFKESIADYDVYFHDTWVKFF